MLCLSWCPTTVADSNEVFFLFGGVVGCRRNLESGHAPPAARTATAATGSGSAEGPALASAEVARSTARSEIAARAALAAEKRAAASSMAGEGVGPRAATAIVAVLPGIVSQEATTADELLDEPDRVPAPSGVAAAVADGTRAVGLSGAVEGAEDSAQGGAAAGEEDIADVTSAAPLSPWPCRRRRGAASLFLSQRQRTGGLRWRGVGVGEAGKGTFRRQALSTVLANGLRTQRLRLGCTSNSRTGAGVARGHPQSQGVQGRVAGGVSCMEFDSVGWQLAVGGENVTVYDFDRYLPEVCLL